MWIFVEKQMVHTTSEIYDQHNWNTEHQIHVVLDKLSLQQIPLSVRNNNNKTATQTELQARRKIGDGYTGTDTFREPRCNINS